MMDITRKHITTAKRIIDNGWCFNVACDDCPLYRPEIHLNRAYRDVLLCQGKYTQIYQNDNRNNELVGGMQMFLASLNQDDVFEVLL